MPTTVHIPDSLLRQLDARAKSLGISRNRLIVQAIEANFVSKRSWPPELVRMLEQPLDDPTAQTLERSLRVVRKRRTNRRRPPKL
jgi:hypothetical protein